MKYKYYLDSDGDLILALEHVCSECGGRTSIRDPRLLSKEHGGKLDDDRLIFDLKCRKCHHTGYVTINVIEGDRTQHGAENHLYYHFSLTMPPMIHNVFCEGRQDLVDASDFIYHGVDCQQYQGASVSVNCRCNCVELYICSSQPSYEVHTLISEG